MLDSLGCSTPELLGKVGFPIAETVWLKAGVQIFSQSGLDYLDKSGVANARSILAVRGCHVVLMGTVESYHLKGGPFGEADELLYLGRAFDPLGLGNDPKTVAELNVQKIKNSHLAMSCVFGYYVQAVVNGESPSSAGAVAECLNGEHPEDCGRDPASLVHARDLSFLFCLSYVLLVVCCL